MVALNLEQRLIEEEEIQKERETESALTLNSLNLCTSQ